MWKVLKIVNHPAFWGYQETFSTYFSAEIAYLSSLVWTINNCMFYSKHLENNAQ